MGGWQAWAFAVVSLAIVFGVNYLFALAGEPRALWLMQVAGVL